MNWKPEIQWRDPKSLTPYARNAKQHSTEQIDKIAGQIHAVGFTQPIVVDKDGIIIAGHGRREAAIRLNLEFVPVVVADHLDEYQAMAARIADNKVAEAPWDLPLLAFDLGTLESHQIDLKLTGLNLEEAQNLLKSLNGPELTDPKPSSEANKTQDPAPTPKTKVGEIWTLGNHRLMCGDSTDPALIDRLMNGEKADMVFTDPPYGMSYGGGRAEGEDAINKETGGTLIKAHGMILGDDKRGEELIDLVSRSVSNAAKSRKDDGALYVCFTWRTYPEFYAAMKAIGLTPKGCIVWDKGSIGLGYSHYRPQHEFIFYFEGAWHGDSAQSDVWNFSRGATGEYVHPTQKPVELIERAIGNSSQQGGLVLDVFGGSGSTLIAAERLQRRCFTMELDPKYCDAILTRWAEYSGKDPIREDGVAWSTVKNAP